MTETETMTETVIGTETETETEIGTGTGTGLIKLRVAPRDGEGAPLHLLCPMKGAVGALRNGKDMLMFLEKLLRDPLCIVFMH